MINKYSFVIISTLVSGGAFAATTVCDGTQTTSQPASAAITSTQVAFIVTPSGFTPNCSANALVIVDGDSSKLYGASGSAKGKTVFVGSTNGGGVQPSGSGCPSSGCTSTEVNAEMSAAGSM